MYKVILVDDEPAILNSLRSVIPWEEYGFDTIKCVSNAEEALYYLQCHPVDLLITDIKMPQMNGIILMHRVSKRYKNIGYIVLTAYDEFEYAREALQLGAENYLLKPINVKELEFSVRKALDNLNSRRIAEQTLNSNYCVFKDNLLSRWLDGSIEESELRERAGIMSINIFCRNYCVVLLKLLEQSLKINTFLDNIKHYLCSEYNCYYLIESHGAHAFIIDQLIKVKRF